MRKSAKGILIAAIALCAAVATGQGAPSWLSGWSLLQEGEGAGTIEPGASNPSNAQADGKLLKIAVSKTAAIGKGRVGAVQSTTFAVAGNTWYDINFSAMTQTGSVGLVFSLESADGKVLARTTLPEIGQRRGRGRGAGRGRRGGRGAPGATTTTTSISTTTITTTAIATTTVNATTTTTAVAANPAPAPAPAPVPWPKYLVSLHTRASDPKAHLVVVPIEPTTIWIEDMKLAEHKSN